MILVVLLGISAAGNALFLNRWMAAKMDYAAEEERYTSFVNTNKVLGDAQAKKAAAKETSDKNAKEKTDNELKKTQGDLAGVYASYLKLLNAGYGSNPSAMPGFAAAPGESDRVCLSRAAFDRGMAEADGRLQVRAAGILQKGDSAIGALNNAKNWAKEYK